MARISKKSSLQRKQGKLAARSSAELARHGHAQAAASPPNCQPGLAISTSTSTSGAVVLTSLGSSSESKTPAPVGEKHQDLMERIHRELGERERLRKTFGAGARLEPVVMWERISVQAFRGWLERFDELEKLRWNYEALDENTGRVVIYELASGMHGTAAANIMSQIQDQVRLAGDNLDPPLGRQCGSTYREGRDRDLHVGRRTYQPDDCLRPRFAWADAFPTLVVEIAYSEEIAHLDNKLHAYMTHPAIQVAIGVKIPYRGDEESASIIVLQRELNGDLDEYEAAFGDGVALPDRLPSFPIWKMYVGSPLPTEIEPIQNELIVIDLQLLNEDIAFELAHLQ